MEKLISILDDANVDVASPHLNNRNEYDKLDKERVKLQLQTRKDLDEIQMELFESTFEVRKNWILKIKEEANTEFQLKKFDNAQKLYLKALMGLTEKDLSAEEQKQLSETKFAILCNMAIAALELKMPKKSISLLDQAAKISNSAKLNYIYAIVYFGFQDYQKACDFIDQAYEMVVQAKDEIRVEFYKKTMDKMHFELQKHVNKEKNMYKKMFGEEILVNRKLTSKNTGEIDLEIKTKNREGICQKLLRKIKLILSRNK